jgi:Ca2+/Na+ antiporter
MEGGPGGKATRYLLLPLLGIVRVVVSANFLVDSASSITLLLGVLGVIVGATVVAFGTSVPELATSIETRALTDTLTKTQERLLRTRISRSPF